MKKYAVKVELHGFFSTRVVVSDTNALGAQIQAINVIRAAKENSIAFSPLSDDYYPVTNADIVENSVVLTPVFSACTDTAKCAARTDVMALAHTRSMGEEEMHVADQSTLALMMCDMRHWCRQHNISFEAAIGESKMHFEAEQPFVENVA